MKTYTKAAIIFMGSLIASEPIYNIIYNEVYTRQNATIISATNVIPTGNVVAMTFFTESIDTLSTLVVLIGAGLAAWGVINLMEGYGNDNPGAKSQGMKQLMAGAGIAIVGLTLIPQLITLF